MLDQHDRHAGIGNLAYQFIDFQGFLRIQTSRRLVEKDDAWLHRQCAGNFQTLQGTVGHRIGTLGNVGFKADKAHQLGCLVTQLRIPFA